jgi:hypothetical protein
MLVMKEYLLYLLGELTEYHSERYPNSRFWKNDEYGLVLELTHLGILWVHDKIWCGVSNFFSIEYIETRQLIKYTFEEQLKLEIMYPHVSSRLEPRLKIDRFTIIPILPYPRQKTYRNNI